MQVILFVFFILTAILQLAAIYAGIEYLTGSGVLSFFLSIFIFFIVYILQIPLVGFIFGMIGAILAWDWPWYLAVVLFLGPFSLMYLIAISFGYSYNFIKDLRFRKKQE